MLPLEVGLSERADWVVIGTSFASAFFLLRALERLPADARVVVLERGERRDAAWHRTNQQALLAASAADVRNETPEKPWAPVHAFGGASNAWWACTPRLHPSDFSLRSRYGVGADWLVGYDDLEPHYAYAEEVMLVSGETGPGPRSTPYPQPPHRMTSPDRALAAAFPGSFLPMPCARARLATPWGPACCASGTCNRCPVGARFTIQEGLPALFSDPRVTVRTGAQVVGIESQNRRVTAVVYRTASGESRVEADRVALAAGAFANAHLLLRSGFDDGVAGRGLVEQLGVRVDVRLRGLEGLDGSTSLTAHGYPHYDGPWRKDLAGALIETQNLPELRPEPGRWRERVAMKWILEDEPRYENRVTFDPEDPDRPVLTFERRSARTEAALRGLSTRVEEILGALPVEDFTIADPAPTEWHALCTTRMGDRGLGVVDRNLVHHDVSGLLVLGGSVFPTCPSANPTLTICALSLWAATQAFA